MHCLLIYRYESSIVSHHSTPGGIAHLSLPAGVDHFRLEDGSAVVGFVRGRGWHVLLLLILCIRAIRCISTPRCLSLVATAVAIGSVVAAWSG